MSADATFALPDYFNRTLLSLDVTNLTIRDVAALAGLKHS